MALQAEMRRMRRENPGMSCREIYQLLREMRRSPQFRSNMRHNVIQEWTAPMRFRFCTAWTYPTA